MGREQRVRLFPSRNGPIRCGCGPYDSVHERLDVNGDGLVDEVVWLSRCSYEGTVRAGHAVYFRTASTTGRRDRLCVDLPARVEHDEEYLRLSRLHPCGAVVPVVVMRPFLGDACSLHGLDDESVRVECRSSSRTLMLRWDVATFRLIPEGAPPDARRKPRRDSSALARAEGTRPRALRRCLQGRRGRTARPRNVRAHRAGLLHRARRLRGRCRRRRARRGRPRRAPRSAGRVARRRRPRRAAPPGG